MDYTIDYEKVLKQYSWIVKRELDCVLNPDTDGLLCGLFMSHYLGWHIRGFYDGKVLVLVDIAISGSRIKEFSEYPR